jgi:hypothetical protein
MPLAFSSILMSDIVPPLDIPRSRSSQSYIVSHMVADVFAIIRAEEPD